MPEVVAMVQMVHSLHTCILLAFWVRSYCNAHIVNMIQISKVFNGNALHEPDPVISTVVPWCSRQRLIRYKNDRSLLFNRMRISESTFYSSWYAVCAFLRLVRFLEHMSMAPRSQGNNTCLDHSSPLHDCIGSYTSFFQNQLIIQRLTHSLTLHGPLTFILSLRKLPAVQHTPLTHAVWSERYLARTRLQHRECTLPLHWCPANRFGTYYMRTELQ